MSISLDDDDRSSSSSSSSSVPSLLALCLQATDDAALDSLPLVVRRDPAVQELLPTAALLRALAEEGLSPHDQRLHQLWRRRFRHSFRAASSASYQGEGRPDPAPSKVYFGAILDAAVADNDASAFVDLQRLSEAPLVTEICIRCNQPLAPVHQILGSLPTMTQVEFRWIKKQHVAAISEILSLFSSSSFLERLSFVDCLLDDPHFCRLLNRIPSSVVELSIANATLRQASLLYLERRVLGQLKKLVLDESGMETDRADHFVMTLAGAQRLRELTLHPTSWPILELPPNLVSLSLDFDDDDTIAVPSFAKLLALRKLRLANLTRAEFRLPADLRELTLYQCKLNCSNIQSFLDCLRPNTLLSLDLSQNRLKSDSIPILERFLVHSSRSLRRLSLSSCGLVPTTSFVEAIARSRLVDLDLSHNQLGVDAIPLLVALLANLGRTFDRLDLSSNRIVTIDCQMGAMLFNAPPSMILFLDLRWNLFSIDQLQVEWMRKRVASVQALPSASNLVCDAIQATSWADIKAGAALHSADNQ